MNHRESRTAAESAKPDPNSPGAGAVAALHESALGQMRAGQYLEAQLFCQQALAIDDGHADSLHLMGLLALHAKQYDHALEWISRAIRRQPKAAFLISLGDTLLNQGRREEAVQAFDKAVQLAPDDANLWRNLGNALAESGRLPEATLSFQHTLKLRPDFTDIWLVLGDLLGRQQRFDEALLAYDHVLALDAGNAEAARKGGSLLLELNRFNEALARFDLLVILRPDQAEVYDQRAACLSRLARWDEAAANYRKSLEIAPHSHDSHNNLGMVLVESRSFDEALTHFRKAVEIESNFIAALNNSGIALINLNRAEEAVSTFNRALSISPDVAELFSNKANALKALGRTKEALSCYDRAIALKPGYAQAHNNRGCCLDDMKRGDEALSSYHRALDLQPDYADAHWNIAVNRLRAGDFETGWMESEWRWKCPALRLSERGFSQKLWLGAEPICDKTLLLHSDQGLGDALQFCRYAPLVAAQGARVVLEVQPPLRELLSRLNGVSRVIAKGEPLPDFDLHCPLGSLPLAFATTIETIPSEAPYLSAGVASVGWGPRPAGMLRIGLVWSGNPKHANDHNRSIPLKMLLPLLNMEAQFVSLQKDLRPDDEAVLRQRDDIVDVGPTLESFADTAAVLKQLDLVISVDTSVAHLAGALGRPVWILLPYVPDWRWLLNREDSPWYPTARLFRQNRPGDYVTVLDRMRDALRALIGASAAGQ